MTHTPGPWFARGTDIPKSRRYSIMSFTGHKEDNGAARVGGVDTCHVTKDQALANARLIAAAPDLLWALKKAVADYGRDGGPWNVPNEPGAWLSMARSAIADAEGGAP